MSEPDNFLSLIEEIVEHPVRVLATLMYWSSISAQARTFVDRLTALLDDHKDLGRALRGKTFAMICSGAAAGLAPSFEELLDRRAHTSGHVCHRDARCVVGRRGSFRGRREHFRSPADRSRGADSR